MGGRRGILAPAIAFAAIGAAEPPQAPVDLHGDPLPPGAAGRLGTTRWRFGKATYAGAFSPDGRTLALGAGDGAAHLMNMETGRIDRRLAGHAEKVLALAYSPDGKTLASGGADNAISVWDLETGRERFPIRGHGSDVTALAFSPDGKTLASGCEDGVVGLWEAGTGRGIRKVQAREGEVRGIGFLADGRTLLSWADNGVLQVHDASAERDLSRLRKLLEGHRAEARYPNTYALFPDGKTLAAGVRDTTPERFRSLIKRPEPIPDTERFVEIRRIPPHAGSEAPGTPAEPSGVACLAVSPDGKTVVAGLEPGAIEAWTASGNRRLFRVDAHLGGVLWIAISPDGKTLASGGHDSLRLCDAETGKPVHGEAGHTALVSSVAWAPDGKELVSGSLDGTLRIWNPGTGKTTRTIPAGDAPISQVAWAPDGRRIAAATEPGTVSLWDAGTGNEASRLSWKDCGAIALSPDGKTLAGAGEWIRLWDLDAQAASRGIEGRARQVDSIAFAPDGILLATHASDHSVRLWDLARGAEVRCLKEPGGPIAGTDDPAEVAFSPDGKWLAAPGPGESLVRIWAVSDGSPVVDLPHTMGPVALAFSPDGSILATSVPASIARERTPVRLWETATGLEIATLSDEPGASYSISFSPDGRLLAAANGDSTILLWDVLQIAGGRAREIPDPTPGLRPPPLRGAGRGPGGEVQESAWTDLAGEDAPAAWRAIAAFAAGGDAAARFLGRRVAAPPPEAEAIRRLVADLDADDFEAREAAQIMLAAAGPTAIPILREALAGEVPPELKARGEKLLETIRKRNTFPLPPGEPLRRLRAIHALERIGTPAARDALEALAKGSPDDPVAPRARDALRRLPVR